MECPECGYEAPAYEFEEHIGAAPDLLGTFECPECEHGFDE